MAFPKYSNMADDQTTAAPAETVAPTEKIKKRSPVMVLILPFITFGIYVFYWIFKTTHELRDNGGDSVPATWILLGLLIPGVNIVAIIIYMWMYSKALEEVTGAQQILHMLLLLFITPVGMLLVQTKLNEKATA